MDPEVIIDPDRCICVLGPQVTAEYLSTSPNGVPAVLSYRGLVDSGINRLLELEQFATEADRQRRHTLLKNAYELEPTFAAHKVVESLRTFDCYEQWLSDCFAPLQHARPSSKTATLEWLQGLKAKGLPLAYMHYDSVLDNALNTTPLLLDNEEVVTKWAAGKIPGLLHLHGIASLPGSVKLDCLTYETTVGDSPGAKALKQICMSKNVVLLGFDDIYFDPCIGIFASTFVSAAQSPSRYPLLLTASSGAHTCGPSYLTLRFAHRKSLDKVFNINTSLGSTSGLFSSYHASVHHGPSHPVCVSLCYASTSGPLVLKQLRAVFPGARFSLSLDGSCPVVSVSFGRNDLRRLWKELFLEPLLPVPLHSSLMGFILDDDSVAIWLSSKPKLSLGAVTNQHHPMIWAMPSSITTPAVSKVVSSSSPIPSFQHQSLPPIPSSLLSSMQHFVADNSTPPHGTPLPSLYAQFNRLHQQPRRMRSDNQIQSMAEDIRRPKNGILLHHASAPSFPFVKEPLQHEATPISVHSETSGTEGRLIAVPSPHTLKIEEVANEHMIEYIDQYQLDKHATPPTSRSAHGKRGRERERSDSNEVSNGGGGGRQGSTRSMMPPPAKKQMIETEFDKARLKFITEAKEWSQKIEETIGKKVEDKKISPSPCSRDDRSTEGGSSGGCSREEQERLLQKHFANLVPPQHHLPPKVLPLPHLRMSPPSHGQPVVSGVPPIPLGWGPLKVLPSSGVSGSGDGGGGSGGGSHGDVPLPTSANAETVKLPSSLPSVFLAPNSMGVVPYLTPNAGLQTTATMLCNPALFNSYAALQMMSSGGKPMLLSDIHWLQNLQNFFAQQQNSERLSGISAEAPLSQSSQTTAKQSGPQLTKGESSPPQTTHENVRQNNQPQESSKLSVLPKRRRSNSLPGGLGPFYSSDRRELLKGVLDHSPMSPPAKDQVSAESFSQLPQPPPQPPPPPPPLPPSLSQALPPPLIQLPKELRQMYDPMLSYTSHSPNHSQQQQQQQQQLNDPMLSYTTPSQGSPLGVVQFGFVPNNSFRVLHTTPANHELSLEREVSGGGDGAIGSGEEEEDEGVELRESGAGGALSSDNSTLPPFPAGRGPIQLWQFLLDLLTSTDKKDMIRWTGNGYEFHILQPEEVAKLWGARKNKPKMNYDKLSRGLRYYYSKGIMDKVPGKKLTFKYTCDVQQYIEARSLSSQQASQASQTPSHTALLLDEDSFQSDDES